MAITCCALVLSTGVAACAGDDPIDPVEGCRDFIDAWCNKQVECAVATDRTRVGEDCRFASGLSIDCSEVKALGTSYDACMRDVPAISCAPVSSGNALMSPNSCKGILLR